MKECDLIFIMGVAASGKSSVGDDLARRLGWRPIVDADSLHPPENVRKMSAGFPLNDRDRKPWLLRINERVREHQMRGERKVVACSALKHEYRRSLVKGVTRVQWVFLDVSYEILLKRLLARKEHFFKDPKLLKTQLKALERPNGNTLIVKDPGLPVRMVSDLIFRQLKEKGVI